MWKSLAFFVKLIDISVMSNSTVLYGIRFVNMFHQEISSIWQKFSNPTVCGKVIKNAIDHHFYLKINIFSVKSTVLLKKLLNSWFHERFLGRFPQMVKCEFTFMLNSRIFFWAWLHFILLFHTLNNLPKKCFASPS